MQYRGVTSVFLAAVAVTAIMAQPAVAQTKLVFDVYMPRTQPIFTGIIVPFQKDVAKVTNGRVKVEFPAAKISGSKRQYDSVLKGVSDVAVGFVGWQRKSLLLPQVGQLPFTTSTAEKAAAAMWRTYKKFFEQANEYKGVKLLSFDTHPGNTIYTRNTQIRSLADFKGIKFRASAGESKQVIESLGGTAVTSSGPQIFEFVSKGVVDGIITTDDSLVSFRVLKFLKHGLRTPTQLGNNIWSVMMNLKKWDGLSKADQKAIMSISGEKLARSGGRKYDERSKAARDKGRALGIKYTQAEGALLADIKKRLAPMRGAWFKKAATRGVDGPAALAYFIAQQKLIN